MSDKIKSQPKKFAVDFFINNLWKKRASGSVDPDEYGLLQHITKSQVDYLLNLYPFIDIANASDAGNQPYADNAINQLHTRSGWIVYDYGNSIKTSLGYLLYADYRSPKAEMTADQASKSKADGGDDGSGSAHLTTDGGTIFKQTLDVADELINIIIAKGWREITILNGSPNMQWMVWFKALEKGLTVYGYTADISARKRRIRVSKAQADLAVEANSNLNLTN